MSTLCHSYARNRHLLATSMELRLDQIAYMITAAHLVHSLYICYFQPIKSWRLSTANRLRVTKILA